MPRLKSADSGVTVSCSKETAALLGSEWEVVDDGYGKWTVDELNAEIDKRNKNREDADHIAPEGTKKADLIAALEADDNK